MLIIRSFGNHFQDGRFRLVARIGPRIATLQKIKNGV